MEIATTEQIVALIQTLNGVKSTNCEILMKLNQMLAATTYGGVSAENYSRV